MQRCLDGTQTLGTALHETGFQISVTHLLLGPAQREAGILKLLLHESKDMTLDTVSLSMFKKQQQDTVVTFHIYLLQRTACVHKAKVPYSNQKGYIQTASWEQRLACATQSTAGKGAGWPAACTTICSMNREHARAWVSAPGLLS